MRRGLILFSILPLLAVLMLVTEPAPADASCAEMPTPETALKRSDAVFSGVVLSVENTNKSKIGSSDDPLNVTFRVAEAWKGVDQDRVTVRTTAGNARFVTGDSYIVYAEKTLLGLSVGPCTRTASLEHAAEDLAFLGKGEVPPPSPDTRANPSGGWLFPAVTALAALAAAAFAFMTLRLRRRH